jgi:hypothetical protein
MSLKSNFISELIQNFFRNLTTSGRCLLNSPTQTLQTYYNSSILPGQLYSLDQQCKLLLGTTSNYDTCSVKWKLFILNT